jgi:hypothetical protein
VSTSCDGGKTGLVAISGRANVANVACGGGITGPEMMSKHEKLPRPVPRDHNLPPRIHGYSHHVDNKAEHNAELKMLTCIL